MPQPQITLEPAPFGPCPLPAEPILRLTYPGLVSFLADVEDRPETTLDLKSLEHGHMAILLCEISDEMFMDALADSTVLRGVLAHFLADPKATLDERSQLVGVAVIAAIRDYLRPLLLKAVQAQWDRNRETAAIEAPLSHYAALTDEQVVAQELGLGRSLS